MKDGLAGDEYEVEKRTLFICGSIGDDEDDTDRVSVLVHDVYRKVSLMLDQGDDPIRVIINSNGGVALDALAIHDILRDAAKKVKVVTEVHGMAASGASVILQAGTERCASENSLIVVHDVRGGTRQSSTVEDMVSSSVHLKKIHEKIVKIFVERAGMDKEKAESILKAESLNLDPSDALELGIIDRIIGEDK